MRYSDLGNGRFQNPILFADYSDPDVIRVGDTFYLTASSFNYTPGLPILVSKDLVNWELKNYALKNIGEERFKVPRHSEGVWAPSIRYHNGMFYIYYGMPDEGYYVVRAKDPLGEWDAPVRVLDGKGLIDPCPIWDDDGRAYIIHGYAKSRIGFKSILGIFEMDEEGLKAISEDHFIFNGNDPEHPAVTIEGPKVYKRNGYYYILAPAGGVREGYQVALRSQNIRGPYEIKTVMASGSTVINGPHQGGLVDTESGQEWFIHFQDRGLYGRICHLQPVCWKEEWPVIGVESGEEGCGEPAFELSKPDTGHGYVTPAVLEASDDFRNGNIGLQWQWLGDSDSSFAGKADSNDGIRLYALNPSGDTNPTIWRSANVLTQKIIYPVFTAEFVLDASGLAMGSRAGIVMTGGQYITAYVERNNRGYTIRLAESEGGDLDKRETVRGSLGFDDICKTSGITFENALKDIRFKMTFDIPGRNFASSELYFQNANFPIGGSDPILKIELGITKDNGSITWKDLGSSYTPSDHTWVGAKIGIYALSNSSSVDMPGYADFYKVSVEEPA